MDNADPKTARSVERTEKDDAPATAASRCSPDIAEQDCTVEDDMVPPTRGYSMMPMVGLGGSLGGMAALQTFLSATPADTGMAFVVVLHLSPDHESKQAEILQRSTAMPVLTATDGARVLANHVYVIPQGKHLISADGHLRLTELDRPRGKRVAVDLFFRTLADTHGPHAAAIVLSGADGDGAIGIKRIKERGGLTIVQDPSEAEASGMPRSAIATGMVDWVLPVADIPVRLLGYRRLESRLKLPPEEGPPPAQPVRPSAMDEEVALREILVFLRMRTGRDFAYYKRGTILRRISRRMQVNGVGDMSSYLVYLRTHPGEAGALLADLLISVTNFFRDRDAFNALEAKVPELFKGKGPNDTLRIWVVACATGEEAYSIALLLCEHARKLEAPPVIQIFATDLNDEVIQTARDAIYPDTIAADVSEERLRRFFIKEERGYRLRREVREIVLFAQHDVLKDSPFSRIDAISCRNLLIYLNREAQEKALEIFHFALRAGGLLFLGTSESVEDNSPLFTAVDKKHRLYTHQAGTRPALHRMAGANIALLALEARERAGVPSLPGIGFENAFATRPNETPARAGRDLSWSELHSRLIERLSPPSVLVNATYDIVHMSDKLGAFLTFPIGKPSLNLLDVVNPPLRIELRAVLYRAAQTQLEAEALQVPCAGATGSVQVDIRVLPAGQIATGYFLVTFHAYAATGTAGGGVVASAGEVDPAAQQLERELERMKTHLRDTTEQHEASIEELRASNEELHAMNEELRSATEELETSREEQQSINEELTTVNQELKSKVDELGHANSDLHNLMASTAIATVFLDSELRVTRYTPPAVGLFNLIPSDIGRPLADLKDRLDYAQLSADARRVLEQLAPVEREVRGLEDRWFLARLLPYRTTEDHIAGVVLTLFDITERRNAVEQLRRAREELESRVQQRTAELAEANRALSAENVERMRAEKARHDMMRQLAGAQEAERSRISRGLHDEVGQHLTALMLELRSLPAAPEIAPDKKKLEAIRRQVETVGSEIHKLALELRPTALDDLGLLRALTNYAEEWSNRCRIEVDLHQSGFEGPRLPELVETTIFRIVCEALNNVVKHADASSVSIVLTRTAEQATAIVEDDGVGFEPGEWQDAANSKRLGLLMMKERAVLLDGDVTIESKPGRGTTVFVRLPLKTASPP